MITSLAKFALGFMSPGTTLQHAKRLVTIALVVVGLLLLGGGGWWACSAYKESVIETDRLEGNNAALEAKNAADQNAADQRVDDVIRSAKEVEELREIIDAHPDPDRARREFYRCVRLQQDARAAGKPAPSCRGSGGDQVDAGSSGGGLHDGATGSE